ncbi:GNAT family N-acetyltransferase [Halobacillus amylolyticus]|uniref:GNAT family N-acetyltransferase n=1 Tax=Halobacillus amylolyticus TaxID=2932259 RepID=A0ABY4HCF8_9BACI|nr:GNAT family N-acetyltransferase [Halobacillus amylolyticus]UOR12579.1 GNAT family N-acetyltransferase [Halobacillus amylolyticus]
MISIIKANKKHIKGIAKVCTDGYWSTYRYSHSKEYIERIVEEFYNEQRIKQEVTTSNRGWGGYFVAVEDRVVLGAGGGGMISEKTGEVYVMYLNPSRRNEGIGTKLLAAITNQQKEWGAEEQWVSVTKGNQKGIPFYEARGFQYSDEKESYSNTSEENYLSLRYYRPI